MLNILLIGPQGCGKGTQAEKLISSYSLTHIEAGSLIRSRASLHDRKAEIIDHLANKKGQLLPDGIVLDMIHDELEIQKSIIGYLFDGFPRSVIQYEALQEMLASKEMAITAGIYLSISDTESIKRLSSRRLCDQCNRGYSLILEPDRTNCDCGGNLIVRPDDNPEAIKSRLSLFHQTTEPILALLRAESVLLEINGEQSIDKIFADIKDRITKLNKS